MPPRTRPPLRVVLYAPRIPQNVGQIGRLCLALNAELHLIRPLGFRLGAAALRRACVGYWEVLRPTVHADAQAFFEAVGDPERLFLVSTQGQRPFDRVDYEPGDWLLFGNETEGLPGQWLRANPDHTLYIPMANPRVRCLNLATAVTAVVFQALGHLDRQKAGPARSGLD